MPVCVGEGGSEVYLIELALRHPDVIHERVAVRKSKLLKGSRLNRGAILNAASVVRETPKKGGQ